jgi:hypothetical protein
MITTRILGQSLVGQKRSAQHALSIIPSSLLAGEARRYEGRFGSKFKIRKLLVGRHCRIDKVLETTVGTMHCSDFRSDDCRLDLHGKHMASDRPYFRTVEIGPRPKFANVDQADAT